MRLLKNKGNTERKKNSIVAVLAISAMTVALPSPVALGEQIVNIAADEVYTISDLSYIPPREGDSTTNIVENDTYKIKPGGTIKILAGAASVTNVFNKNIIVDGSGTAYLDLTDYDGDEAHPFHLSYTVWPGAANAKLHVKMGTDKRFRIGALTGCRDSWYGEKDRVACVLSYDVMEFEEGTQLNVFGAAGLYSFPANCTMSYTRGLSTDSAIKHAAVFCFGTNMFGTTEGTVMVDKYDLYCCNRFAVNKNQKIKVSKDFSFSQGSHHQVTYKSGAVKEDNRNCDNDIELVSGSILRVRCPVPYFNGKITGTGKCTLMGWTQSCYVKGVLDAALEFVFGQRGSQLYFDGATFKRMAGTVNFSTTDNYTGGSDHIIDLKVKGYGTEPTWAGFNGFYAVKCDSSHGCTVKMYGKQSLSLEYIDGGYDTAAEGGIRFTLNGTNPDPAAVTVNRILRALTVFQHPNISMTVSNVTKAATFSYPYAGDNRSSLNLLKCTVAPTVTGPTPKQLPRKVTGNTGALNVTENEWTVEIDPSAADPVLNGCEGSGALTVPETGTITIVNKTGGWLPFGSYPIMTCTSGGAALTEANWPVTLQGFDQTQVDELRIVRNQTGIWLKNTKGMIIMLK